MRSSGVEHPDRSRTPDTAEDTGIQLRWDGEGKDTDTSTSEIQGIKTQAVLGRSFLD